MFKKLFQKKHPVEDTRKFKRLRGVFILKYRKDGEGAFQTGSVLNISAGGIRFAAREELPASSLLTVDIHFPLLKRTLETQVKVSRVTKIKQSPVYEIAASFMKLRLEDRDALNELVEALYQNPESRGFVDHHDVASRKKG